MTHAWLRAAVAAVVALLAGGLLAGCGGVDGTATEPPSPSTSPSSPEGTMTDPPKTPAPPPTPRPTPSGTTVPPSEALQKIRVVGEVVAVGDCVVVRDDNDITWTAVGELAGELVLGDRVAVTGAPDLVRSGCGGPLVRVRAVDVLS